MCNVLVVDDDPTILEIVAEALAFDGHDVRTATDGQEGIEALEGDGTDVVLLDMRMPRLDGWGFAREVEARGIHVPIIVMTAAQDARQWCAEIHGQDCLPKPFDIDALFHVVDRFCHPAA
ncbi:MAG: two-component system, OmpR family, response regulator MprA [Chloroflexota bacterium]|jgi:two-component system response regulator MprA|nr:two-component system, OmpR family, response regulator MprA [Chloroflexota bacterium]